MCSSSTRRAPREGFSAVLPMLAARRVSILIEVHPWSLGQLGESHESVLRQITAAGFGHELIATDGNSFSYVCTPLP
jgi:hypothetical protein